MNDVDVALKASLQDGVSLLNLPMTENQQSLLLEYVQRLIHWNKAYNLVSCSDPQDLIYRHLLDSLSVFPWLEGSRCVDVGSGAGLPGIPLAIMCPERRFLLLDSNGKRCKFLYQTKLALQLENVEVHRGRCEQYQPAQGFDNVISRAFASLADFIQFSSHLVTDNGRLLAMKGQLTEQELCEVHLPYNVAACHQLDVPGLDAERCLVVIIRLSGERN